MADFIPGCFGSVLAYSEECDVCRECVKRDECRQQVEEYIPEFVKLIKKYVEERKMELRNE